MAVDTGVPVVPVVIRGTRRLLKDEQWWFRRSAIAVEVRPPIELAGTGFSGAVALRDATRDSIAAVCGEPDLLGATVRSTVETKEVLLHDRMVGRL